MTTKRNTGAHTMTIYLSDDDEKIAEGLNNVLVEVTASYDVKIVLSAIHKLMFLSLSEVCRDCRMKMVSEFDLPGLVEDVDAGEWKDPIFAEPGEELDPQDDEYTCGHRDQRAP
jgi:hypothetical protein